MVTKQKSAILRVGATQLTETILRQIMNSSVVLCESDRERSNDLVASPVYCVGKSDRRKLLFRRSHHRSIDDDRQRQNKFSSVLFVHLLTLRQRSLTSVATSQYQTLKRKMECGIVKTRL